MSGKSGHLAQLLLIQRERDALRETNCKLRDKLLELAKECSGCDGTGVQTVRGFEGRGQAFERQEPCRDCADIREVLES